MQIMTALRLIFLHSSDIVSNHPVIFKNLVKKADMILMLSTQRNRTS
jgi:hypothetical protein